MVVVGLTGGIGAGKSTVSAMLADRGAVVVDADVVAREVVVPGGPAYDAVVDRFGPGVVAADGTLDRAGLAQVVFADGAARADLEAIVHPAVKAAMDERVAAEAGSGHVVVLDIPLLVESRAERHGLAGVVVVDCPVETAVRRLVERRGLAEDDARARVAAQASRAERLARADFVIDNAGDLTHLAAEVERCWAWIEGLRAAG